MFLIKISIWERGGRREDERSRIIWYFSEVSLVTSAALWFWEIKNDELVCAQLVKIYLKLEHCAVSMTSEDPLRFDNTDNHFILSMNNFPPNHAHRVANQSRHLFGRFLAEKQDRMADRRCCGRIWSSWRVSVYREIEQRKQRSAGKQRGPFRGSSPSDSSSPFSHAFFFSPSLVGPTFLICARFRGLINIDDWAAPPLGNQFSSVLIITEIEKQFAPVSTSLRSKPYARLWLKRNSRIGRVDVKRSIVSLWREMIFIDIYSAKQRAFQFHREGGGREKFFPKLFLLLRPPLSFPFRVHVWSAFYRKLFSSKCSLPRTSCWTVWKCLSLARKVRRDRRRSHSSVHAHTRLCQVHVYFLH